MNSTEARQLTIESLRGSYYDPYLDLETIREDIKAFESVLEQLR